MEKRFFATLKITRLTEKVFTLLKMVSRFKGYGKITYLNDLLDQINK